MAESSASDDHSADLFERVPCGLCGADDVLVIYPARPEASDRQRTTAAFRASGDEILVDQLVRCRRCGLKYLNPRLRHDLIAAAYREAIDETFISQASARELTFRTYLGTLQQLAGGSHRLLDIGTGGGSFLGVAKRGGWDVLGCEPSRWLAAWGERHYDVTIRPGTAFDLGLEEATFEVVSLWDVLEHVPDPAALVRECRRLLKPGGVLVVNVPDIGSLPARLMGRKWVFLLSVHLYYFTVQTLTALLEREGFVVLRRRRHWQYLELGYVTTRMNAYLPGVAKAAERIIGALGLSRLAIPYWIGQTNVMARRLPDDAPGPS